MPRLTTRKLQTLHIIACNDSYELDVRYAAARQMIAIRYKQNFVDDLPASIIRGLWYRSQRGKAVRR